MLPVEDIPDPATTTPASFVYGDVKSETLKIPGGQSESEYKTVEIYDSSGWGAYMRFKWEESDTWFDEVYYDGKTVGKIIGKIHTLTQTAKKNNIVITGNIVPSTSNTYSLGENDGRLWSVVYAQTQEISHSDKNAKNTIQPLSEAHNQIFDALVPVSYKLNENTSNRTHTGLIAQDVKEAVENAGLTTQDFAGYCEWNNDDGTVGCGLRYGEFISLCIDQIQKLKKRVEELENKLNTQPND